MKARTDIHRPSAINPSEYTSVGWDYHGGNHDMLKAAAGERKRFREQTEKMGWTWSKHEHGGSCYVCGAWASYLVIFLHEPTKTLIMTGEDCAYKMGLGRDAFKAMRRTLERKAGKEKARTLCRDEYGIDIEAEKDVEGTSHIMADLWDKLVRYGSLSEKQVALAKKLVRERTERATRKADREARKAAAPAVPEGRITIRGIVKAIKERESQWGITWKMVVEHTSGWVVWGTIPSSLEVRRGDEVEFTATIERSDRDDKFGFFKRPVKARVLAAAA